MRFLGVEPGLCEKMEATIARSMSRATRPRSEIAVDLDRSDFHLDEQGPAA
jgi:hypothetical protein